MGCVFFWLSSMFYSNKENIMNLREWMFKEELKYGKVAKELGISANYLRNIASGKDKCSESLAEKIEQYFNGNVSKEEVLKWYEQKQRKLWATPTI